MQRTGCRTPDHPNHRVVECSLARRGEGETFPHGYFKVWRLNPNTGDFERFTGWG